LGVMKSMMLKIGKWLRGIGQNSAFITKVSGKLRVTKKLNIELCKILVYPTTEKAGEWVSKNLQLWQEKGCGFIPIFMVRIIQRNTRP
jgi:hypothetical protein